MPSRWRAYALNMKSERTRHLRAVQPVIDFRLRLILGVAVPRLDLAFELFSIAIDLGELIIGELPPLRLDLARELLPVSFDRIPIHRGPPQGVIAGL
jgi:hypothetical protein